tara:strand:+ start:295 stop:420 length:126 start_codon:yes stop_codon:yes gene_type:complete
VVADIVSKTNNKQAIRQTIAVRNATEGTINFIFFIIKRFGV